MSNSQLVVTVKQVYFYNMLLADHKNLHITNARGRKIKYRVVSSNLLLLSSFNSQTDNNLD